MRVAYKQVASRIREPAVQHDRTVQFSRLARGEDGGLALHTSQPQGITRGPQLLQETRISDMLPATAWVHA